ncbi:CNOT1 [Branchiostoma lanceolatum]|uniref:CCR4-NOT transcription complex subunit 1 n=1 Tax=Branchiostoma lanceolatum TaxID=7740 RepID=A0A8K0F1B8_BRALA|nr:CNOT1 [Branchiostoma lanceolatum]
MNLDSLSLALSQISYAVANLSKKNFKSSVAEISRLVDQHGPEADRHLYRCLFSHVDFSGDGKSGGKDYHQTQLLIQECETLITKPTFVSTLCYAVDFPLHHQKSLKPSVQLFPQLTKVLKLNKIQEVVFGLALLNSSILEVRNYAAQFVKQKLPDLLRTFTDPDLNSGCEESLNDIAIEVLHLLLIHLHGPKDKFGIGAEQKEAFIAILKQDFPSERCPVVLTPFLFPDKQDITIERLVSQAESSTVPRDMMEGSLAELMQEVGYGCCASVEECRNTLLQFGVREVTPAVVARVLGMMARTHVGLSDSIPLQSLTSPGGSIWSEGKDKSEGGQSQSWSVDVFVDVLQDLAPHLNWREVIFELDHPGLVLKDAQGLRLLTSALTRALANQDVFPIDLLYRQWKNTEGQLSWFQVALSSPDVFCFADFPCHQVVIDILKSPPDDENREIATWKSLDLIETLLRLSELGHYDQVKGLFNFPIKHCPDMLVLGLLQVNPNWHTLRHELISTLMPIFLGSHPNSAIVLHYAWHGQGQSPSIRQLVMHSMAEWYMRGEAHDQQRLSRILDVAQDLKALSMLLNGTPFAFVIDLACLASRREYLKLDKWLTDKIREHGEPFIQACVTFLKRRVPQVMGGPPPDKEPPKSAQLPPETIGTMLACLQACANNVSQELSETILTMVGNCSQILNKARQPPPGAANVSIKQRPPSGLPPTSGLENISPVITSQPHLSPGWKGDDLPYVSQIDPLAGISSLSLGGNSGTGTIGPGPLAPGNIGGGPIGSGTIGSGTIGSGAIGTGSIGPGSIGPGSIGPGSIGPGSIGPGSIGPGNIGQGSIGPGSIGPGSIGPGSIGPGPIGGGFQSANPLAASFAPPQSPQKQFPVSRDQFPPFSSSGQTSFSSMGSLTSQMQGLGSSSSSGGIPSSNPLAAAFAPPPTSQKDSTSRDQFPPLSTTAQTPFSSMGGFTSQIQGLGTTGSLGMAGMGGAFGQKTGSIGSSQQAALAQQKAASSLRQDVSNVWPEMNQQFSKEIDDEANSYFQRIYNHPPNPTMSIDEVLEMLKKFRDSPIKRERDVFHCMLRNLYQEYRYFHQYPTRELQITATLFGGLIAEGIVSYMALGIALRYVLEALRKPHGSKMYYFGIAALDRFKTRLKDYPQYCQHLAAIPHFQEFPAHLIEYVEFGQQSREPPIKMAAPSTSPPLSLGKTSSTMSATLTTTVTTTAVSSASGGESPFKATSKVSSTPPLRPGQSPSIANATNIDTLLAGNDANNKKLEPPEVLQDKVAFIFNNLSQSNLNQKTDELRHAFGDSLIRTEELRDAVGEEYLPWVSQYLVMKRASIEPNFHTLYSNFIDVLKNADVAHMVIKETFRNIKVLLQADKGAANFSDRSLLKNLGHWLGMLTLAKNKPILQIDIDIKSLLLEAYHKGHQELLYVVPFVAKVLESCSKSKVFKPPNPWTLAIMNVLAELHQEPDLKLNLKFEIEVLCKTLNLDIADLKPGNYLKDKDKLSHIEEQLSAPKNDKPVEEVQHVSSTTGMPSVTSTTTTTTTTAVPSIPPEPKFSFHDVNTMTFAGLAPHISISNNVPLFTAHPQLKACVRPAIERSVQELVHPVVERSIKIAMTTCEQIVKKDFALDPEEARMRAAAHHMVRYMTAGMAMITCREPLYVSIDNNLKTSFLTTLRGATQQQKEMIEQAASMIAQENVELACAFIQKSAVEKAIPEMDKRLATEFELRKHARNEGRRYCDPVVLTYQAERMPEQIRLKVGGVTAQQTAVYEEFARQIPGFLPTNEANQPSGFLAKPMPSFATDEITQIYDRIISELEQHLHAILAPPTNQQVAAMHSLLEAVILARNSREIVTALALLQKAVEGLLDGLTQLPNDPELALRFRDAHLLVLKGLQDQRAYGPHWTNKQVTRVLCECREELKYNLEAVNCLVRARLINMQQYDSHLAQSMENGLNFMSVTFAMQLVRLHLIDERNSSDVTEADLYNTVENLARIAAHSRNAPEGLAALVDVIRQNHDTILDRAPGGPTSMMHSGISQAREYDDPPGLHEKSEYLLREWVNMYHSPAAGRDSSKAFQVFVQQMHQQGILKTDDLITRFFRLCTEMCVDLCYRALSEASHNPTLLRAKCFHTLDAYVRLIALLVKHSGDATNTVTKINLLNKVLGIIVGVLLQDHEVRGTDFQQLPYHRLFIMLLLELNAPEHVLESINFQVLTAFCNTFHILRPSKAPGFAYAWLELVSHRVFIARMLALTSNQKLGVNKSVSSVLQGWGMYAQLLIDLFKFLAPFLRNVELTKPMQLLYKGTLRVLLVLLHDFPEFLCDYHYSFVDVIPPNCIQMRNLILSAFPRNMRLPDPFTPNLKVDMLPEINHPPRILTNFAALIQPSSFKKDLDTYLKTRAPVTFLSDLRSNLQVSTEPGLCYNISLMNALVLYVGTQAITYIHTKGSTPSMNTITHSAHMDIFQNLAVDLDTEGRYLFLNAIANQLRYPNSHTHYFSCTLLYLFAEANSEAIQEQITRVLLERLIVNRPHPWGLLITFIELIKNPTFKFWNHDFVHCAPEIEKLFESVARSCMQQKQPQHVEAHE